MGRARKPYWMLSKSGRSRRDRQARGAAVLLLIPIGLTVMALRACGVIGTDDVVRGAPPAAYIPAPAISASLTDAGPAHAPIARVHPPAHAHSSKPSGFSGGGGGGGGGGDGPVHVNGYYRRDGTYVHSYSRRR